MSYGNISMNYWYVARPNELFLDIDNVSRSIKHARSRLQGAIECGKLDVAYVMQRPSKSKNHLHVIVTLSNTADRPLLFEKYAWEIILHGDIYRGCCNIMRLASGVAAPDILISPFERFTEEHFPPRKRELPSFPHRISDYKCDCASKHNAATMETCPAAQRLRGEFRNAGFFGKPSKNPCTIWPDL